MWAGQGKAYKGEDGSGGGSRRGEERWKRVTGDLNPEAVSLYRKPSECQSCPKETPPKDPLDTVSPGNPQIREEARNAIPPLPYTFVIKGKHTHTKYALTIPFPMTPCSGIFCRLEYVGLV